MPQLVITEATEVGAIAEALPGATEVFRRAGIGFCCGGAEPLATAVAHQGGDLPAILQQLNDLVARAGAQPPQETPALIDHILTRYHAVHREELEWLIPLAQKVETVHGDHEQAPLGLTEVLVVMQGDLDGHMQKEETILFPMMRNGGHPMIAKPIAVMRADHQHEAGYLDQINRITNDLTLPEGACRSWTALYTGLGKLRDDLTAHMALENDVLFPRFGA